MTDSYIYAVTIYEKKKKKISVPKHRSLLKQQMYFPRDKICGSLEPPMLPMFRTLFSDDKFESNTVYYLENELFRIINFCSHHFSI